MNILILEDDAIARMGLSILLKNRGVLYEYDQAGHLLQNVNELNIDIAFIDLDLEEKLIGLDVINELSSRGIKCVALTGHEEDEIILKAYEFGASDFLVKPASEEAIDYIFSKIRFKDISVSQQNITNDVLEKLSNISGGDQNIYIEGETGTGKTVLAKYIHTFISELRDVEEAQIPFVEINCSEISPGLFEAELFGSKKGSFTGSTEDKIGLIEKADGGVLFLDEVGSLSKEVQVKLLKVIEEGKFYRIGDSKQRISKFILISATCENIDDLVKNEKMRTDFYHRINDVRINLPSFQNLNSKRKKLIIKEICKKFPRRFVISDDAFDLISAHHWEGNIRELKKFLVKLYNLDVGIIDGSVIAKYLDISKGNKLKINDELIKLVRENGLPRILEELEDFMINHFYEENNFKSRQTINQLKISNNLFYKYVKREKE